MKLLDARKKLANEIAVPFPMTKLERFALGRALAHTPPGSEGKARKDLFEAIGKTEPVNSMDSVYIWEEDTNVTPDTYEQVVTCTMTERMLKDLSKFVADENGKAPGRHAFALLDAGDRAAWILEPSKE